MSKRGQSKEAGFNPLGWMFTFSDLVTLLLTFFVMLLSMKQPEVQKLKEAFGIFSQGSAGELSLTDMGKVESFQTLMSQITQPAATDLLSAEQELAEALDLPFSADSQMASRLQRGVLLRQEPRGTVITLANDLLFAPGSADLAPKARDTVAKLARVLSSSTQLIAIEGHTDDTRPGTQSPYQTNWALSLARAEAVLQAMLGTGLLDPARLRVAALGDTRPLEANDTPEHRAMNRRTEIVLMTNNS